MNFLSSMFSRPGNTKGLRNKQNIKVFLLVPNTDFLVLGVNSNRNLMFVNTNTMKVEKRLTLPGTPKTPLVFSPTGDLRFVVVIDFANAPFDGDVDSDFDSSDDDDQKRQERARKQEDAMCRMSDPGHWLEYENRVVVFAGGTELCRSNEGVDLGAVPSGFCWSADGSKIFYLKHGPYARILVCDSATLKPEASVEACSCISHAFLAFGPCSSNLMWVPREGHPTGATLEVKTFRCNGQQGGLLSSVGSAAIADRAAAITQSPSAKEVVAVAIQGKHASIVTFDFETGARLSIIEHSMVNWHISCLVWLGDGARVVALDAESVPIHIFFPHLSRKVQFCRKPRSTQENECATQAILYRPHDELCFSVEQQQLVVQPFLPQQEQQQQESRKFCFVRGGEAGTKRRSISWRLREQKMLMSFI